MAASFRNPPAAPPAWVPANIWQEIEATGTDTFLAAWSPRLRLERWGSTLRAIATQPDPIACDERLLLRPAGLPWKPERILWQVEGERSARHLAGTGWTEEVRELNLRYGIDLTPGTPPGLFSDQRENRLHLRSLSPASLLNLFAHTCAFGVLAASGGAATLNIDVSARSLERGRENYQRNQLAGTEHRFWKEDVRKALPRLVRRGETFAAIILDPPTFAHGGRGQAFRIERELGPMLASCGRLLAPGGALLVSINESTTHLRDLERQVRSVLVQEKLSARMEISRRPVEVPATRMPAGLWVIRED
jgi:23S rRNA (cytosine1962-C5)-methyltransferase